ncbi:17298_t:CDS:2 [Dentiscutata heterogama]|uniref:17298_t:CDS:1 n=1 Tax=Dentiscutata heterogama TaxID=1316150 RepID=A0ACA9KT41_9GLOM|nr:17298_t:CDS:2 [Dentiscutata heterogama]
MIQLKTILNVIDNSGAILAECIRVAHGGRYGRIEKSSGGSAANPATKLLIRKGEVKKALVVRTRKETRRPDGRYIKFDDNACILLNNRLEPLATRVLGVVGNELRGKKWGKVVSLAPRITAFCDMAPTSNLKV